MNFLDHVTQWFRDHKWVLILPELMGGLALIMYLVLGLGMHGGPTSELSAAAVLMALLAQGGNVFVLIHLINQNAFAALFFRVISLLISLAIALASFQPQLGSYVLAVSVVGFVVAWIAYASSDLTRVSLGRIWAVGGVCFRDAIRRKVLWVTPLAMLGVVLVSLLQHPVDQPDAIRQTIKFCFFASGLVVTIIALITAATNLPREIESRVVFTIVTKPITRLEIVLGKIVGFARVSAAMLLIMGIFTVGYLHLRAWYLGRQITQTLASPQLDPAQREWLQHFEDEGLLFSQTIHKPIKLAQYAQLPDSQEQKLFILGGAQDAIAAFTIDTSIVNADDPQLQGAVYRFVFNVPFRSAPNLAPLPKGIAEPTPAITPVILSKDGDQVLIPPNQLGTASVDPNNPQAADYTVQLDKPNPGVEISRALLTQLASNVNTRTFNVQIQPSSDRFLYEITDVPVTLQIITPGPDGQPIVRELRPDDRPLTRGSVGREGQQLRAAENGVQPVAMFRFRDVPKPEVIDGRVPFELKVGVDRSGADSDTEDKTTLEVTVFDRVNRKHFSAQPELVNVENRRTAFFTVPAEWVQSADFDVVLKNRTSGSTVGLVQSSVQVVADREAFAINLFKGLFVLWLFSLLVAIVAFFCSTFLSWPIAVVLSLLILLGRWVWMQLDTGSGFGAQVATEFAGNNPGLARVVSGSVDALTASFSLVTSVLPDITPFGVTEQIERGTTIALSQVASPLMVLAVFGLPLIALSYVFLRNKEVAP